MRLIRTRQRGLLFVLLFVAAIAGGCAGLARQEGGPTEARPPGGAPVEIQPTPGYVGPDIVGTNVATGETVQLSSLKGQTVMVNFWATWCGPCKVEMPAMERFYSESQGDVVILAVGVDSSESPEKLAAFAEGMQLTFPVLFDKGAAAMAYRSVGVPTSVFIDKNGVVRARHTGPLTQEEMQELAAETERMGNQQ